MRWTRFGWLLVSFVWGCVACAVFWFGWFLAFVILVSPYFFALVWGFPFEAHFVQHPKKKGGGNTKLRFWQDLSFVCWLVCRWCGLLIVCPSRFWIACRAGFCFYCPWSWAAQSVPFDQEGLRHAILGKKTVRLGSLLTDNCLDCSPMCPHAYHFIVLRCLGTLDCAIDNFTWCTPSEWLLGTLAPEEEQKTLYSTPDALCRLRSSHLADVSYMCSDRSLLRKTNRSLVGRWKGGVVWGQVFVMWLGRAKRALADIQRLACWLQWLKFPPWPAILLHFET